MAHRTYTLKCMNSKQMEFMNKVLNTPIDGNETAGSVSMFDDKHAQFLPWELHNEDIHTWILPSSDKFSVFRTECLVQFILMPEKDSRLPLLNTPKYRIFAHVSHSQTNLAYLMPAKAPDVLMADKLRILYDNAPCNVTIANEVLYPPNAPNEHSYGFGYTNEGMSNNTLLFFRFEEGLKRTQCALDIPTMNILSFNILSKDTTFCTNVHIAPLVIDGAIVEWE